MEQRIRVSLGSAAFVVTLGVTASIITSVVVASRAYRSQFESQDRRDRSIQVKGSARKRITSDLATWTISVRGEGPTLKEAFEPLKFGVDRVQQFLADNGFSSAEVSLDAIQTTPRHARDTKGNQKDEVVAYVLSRAFTVTTPNVKRVEAVAGGVTELIQEGIAVISYAPAYTYSEIASLKIEMLGEASRDARARAEQIVVNGGGTLGEVRGAHMGVMQITQPNSTDVSSEGIYDKSTIDKDVMAVVTLTLALK